MTSLLERLGDRHKRGILHESGEYWQSYGLLRNPFPVNRTIIPELLFDQAPAKQKFTAMVADILGEIPARRALGIVAGPGGGKTHFLRHCRWELDSFCEETRRKFVAVEFQAGSGNVQDMVREAFRKADTVCRQSGATDFLTCIVRALGENDDSDKLLEELRHEDFRNSLKTLVEASASDFKPKDRDKQFDFDSLRETCRSWLDGRSLSETQRKYIKVYSRIGTASVAVRVMTEAFALARRLHLFEGMLLCLDELETLFRRGLSAAQYQAFLQDLRYLYDEAVRTDKGYSLLVLSATTTTGAKNLANINFPTYQRLGFEENARVMLSPVSSFVQVKEFGKLYLQHGHEEWKRRQTGGFSFKDITNVLSEIEMENAYREARSGSQPDLFGPNDVSQASLLEALHRKAEERRKSMERW
jgi:hypothetical protein